MQQSWCKQSRELSCFSEYGYKPWCSVCNCNQSNQRVLLCVTCQIKAVGIRPNFHPQADLSQAETGDPNRPLQETQPQDLRFFSPAGCLNSYGLPDTGTLSLLARKQNTRLKYSAGVLWNTLSGCHQAGRRFPPNFPSTLHADSKIAVHTYRLPWISSCRGSTKT